MSVPEAYPAPRRMVRPFHRPLRALAAAALVGTLATDSAYALTADFIWVDFSDWLIAVASVLGFVSLLVGVIEHFARRYWFRPPLVSALFDFVAWALAVVDLLIHTRDSWTSVMPWGLALSAVAVLMIVVSEIAQRAAPGPVLAEGTA